MLYYHVSHIAILASLNQSKINTSYPTYLFISDGYVVEMHFSAIMLKHGDEFDFKEFRGSWVVALIHLEVFLMEGFHIVD